MGSLVALGNPNLQAGMLEAGAVSPPRSQGWNFGGSPGSPQVRLGASVA